MKAHIEQTLADLGSEITRITTLRDTLLAHYGSLVPIPHITPDLPSSIPSPRGEVAPGFAGTTTRLNRPSSIPSPRGEGRVRGNSNRRKSPARTAGAQLVIDAVAKLSQPFTGYDITTVTQLTKNGAGSAITRWHTNGWLKKIALGQYERTAKFPASAPATAAPAPRPETRSALEAKMQAAIKQRDYNRETGRDSLVEVYQREIDQLDTQLGLLD